jgi:hypothetical protein
MDKESNKVCCVMILENPTTGNADVLNLIDSQGHYVDGCIKLLVDWLNSSPSISMLAEPLWMHLHFHRSASNLKKAFIRVKDAVIACRGLKLDEQKNLTKQKLTYTNHTKPVSYWSQVELVKTLLKLDTVYINCQTAGGMHVERAYLLACAHLQEHKEQIGNVSNIIQFPSPQ